MSHTIDQDYSISIAKFRSIQACRLRAFSSLMKKTKRSHWLTDLLNEMKVLTPGTHYLTIPGNLSYKFTAQNRGCRWESELIKGISHRLNLS